MKIFKGGENFYIGKNNTGEEIKLPFGICDFWKWAYGNHLDNTKRGALAEYIVQRALGMDTSGTQADWGVYDIFYRGKRIEVKSAAYIQAWNLDNDKFSHIIFSIRDTHAWDAQTAKYAAEQIKNNDIYIFAVYEEKDKSAIDISDLSKWGFYVVKTTILDSCFPKQKTVSLNSLKSKINPPRRTWNELKAAVDNLV